MVQPDTALTLQDVLNGLSGQTSKANESSEPPKLFAQKNRGLRPPNRLSLQKSPRVAARKTRKSGGAQALQDDEEGSSSFATDDSFPPQLEPEMSNGDDAKKKIVVTPRRATLRRRSGIDADDSHHSMKIKKEAEEEPGNEQPPQLEAAIERFPRKPKTEDYQTALLNLSSQPPVVVDIAVKSGNKEPNVIQAAASFITNEPMSSFADTVKSSATMQSVGIGYLVINAMTELNKRNDGTIAEFQKEIFQLFSKYQIQ